MVEWVGWWLEAGQVSRDAGLEWHNAWGIHRYQIILHERR